MTEHEQIESILDQIAQHAGAHARQRVEMQFKEPTAPWLLLSSPIAQFDAFWRHKLETISNNNLHYREYLGEPNDEWYSVFCNNVLFYVISECRRGFV